ncbi:hypothetical protein D9M69_684960 [compost metagenome]
MQTIQSRSGEGNVVGSTIRLPRELRDEVKIQAIRAGRSFNTHVVMILKEAAGGSFGDQAPAAKTTHEDGQEAA